MWLNTSPEIITCTGYQSAQSGTLSPSAINQANVPTTLGGSQRLVSTVHPANDEHVPNYSSSWLHTHRTSCSISNITQIQMEPIPLEQLISNALILILKISLTNPSIKPPHQLQIGWDHHSNWIRIHLVSVESRQEEGIPAPSTLQSWYGVLYELSVHPHYQIPFADTLHSECHRHKKGCMPTRLHRACHH